MGERAKRASARAEAEAHSIPQRATGAVITGRVRVGKSKGGWRYPFQRQKNAGHLVFGATQRAHHQQVFVRFWQNNPFSSAHFDQRSDSEAHSYACFPKMFGYRASFAAQSSSCPKRMTMEPRSSRYSVAAASRSCRSG